MAGGHVFFDDFTGLRVDAGDVDGAFGDDEHVPPLGVGRDVPGGAADADDHGGGVNFEVFIVFQFLVDGEKEVALSEVDFQPFALFLLMKFGTALLVHEHGLGIIQAQTGKAFRVSPEDIAAVKPQAVGKGPEFPVIAGELDGALLADEADGGCF